MSSPAGATTHNGAFTQQLPDQNTQALNFESLINSVLPLAKSLPAQNPATAAYNYSLDQNYIPTGDYFLNNYLTGGGTTTPAMSTALSGANTASGYGSGTLFPQQSAASSDLYGAVNANLPYSKSIFSDIYSPYYSTLSKQAVDSPYLQQALSGAEIGSGYGSTAAAGAADQSKALYGAATDVLNTGFDPQSNLYNRGVQQTADYTNATNAMSGIGNTPYGSSVSANALSNYNIDWQDKQLKRQTDAAASADKSALAGYGLGYGAQSLATSAAAAPYSAYNQYITDALAALKGKSTAGYEAAGGTSSLLGGLGTGYTESGRIGDTAANNLATLTGLPYSTGSTIANNALTGLSNQGSLLKGQSNLGLSALTPEEDLAKQLYDYLNLGQSASVNTAKIGESGSNQLASGIGGGISALSGLTNIASDLAS